MNKKYFYDKFITPFNWRGFGTINGGLGPSSLVLGVTQKLKNVSMEVFNSLLDSDSIEAEITDERAFRMPDEDKYLITFQGPYFEEFKNLINDLSSLGIQRYELISNTNKDQEIGSDVYKLTITTGDGISIRVTKAKWIPSFEKINKETAGWSEKNA